MCKNNVKAVLMCNCNLFQSKNFSTENCSVLHLIAVYCNLRAYANNVSAHNVRAYEGKPLRMCRIVL